MAARGPPRDPEIPPTTQASSVTSCFKESVSILEFLLFYMLLVPAVLDYLFARALIVSSSFFCDVDSAPLFSGFLLSC